MTRPPEVKDIEVEIEEIKTRKERAIKEQDFEGAAYDDAEVRALMSRPIKAEAE